MTADTSLAEARTQGVTHVAESNSSSSPVTASERDHERIQRPERKSATSARLAAQGRVFDRLNVRLADIDRATAAFDRLGSQGAAFDRLASPRAEFDRLASPRAEFDRLASPRAAFDRLASPRAEFDRLASPRAEFDRLGVAEGRAAFDRLASQGAAFDRLASQGAALDRLASQGAALDRLASPRAEFDRLPSPRAEFDRLASPRAEFDRLASEGAALDRLASQRAALDRLTEHREAMLQSLQPSLNRVDHALKSLSLTTHAPFMDDVQTETGGLARTTTRLGQGDSPNRLKSPRRANSSALGGDSEHSTLGRSWWVGTDSGMILTAGVDGLYEGTPRAISRLCERWRAARGAVINEDAFVDVCVVALVILPRVLPRIPPDVAAELALWFIESATEVAKRI